MKKKILSMLLIVAMILPMGTAAFAASYTGSLVIKADKTTAKVGDTIVATFTLEGIDSADLVSFVLDYDETTLEYVSSQWSKKGKITNYNVKSTTCYTVFDGFNAVNGDVLKVTFRVISTAKGSTKINATPVIKHAADDYVMTTTPATVMFSTEDAVKYTVRADKSEIKAGESVNFTINMDACTKVRAMGFSINYDTNAFDLSNLKFIYDAGDTNPFFTCTGNKASVLYSKETALPKQDIVTFTLTAKGDIKVGDYTISGIPSILDDNTQHVPAVAVGTSVKVSGSTEPVTPTPAGAVFKLSPETASIAPGGQVKITINFSGAEGVRKMGMQPTYDKDVFTLSDMKWLKVFEDATLQSDDDGKGTASLYLPEEIHFEAADVLEYTLTAKTTAPAGSYTVGVKQFVSGKDNRFIENSATTSTITIGKYIGNGAITLDKTTAAPGDEVVATFSLSGVDSADLVSFILTHDQNVLEYVSSQWIIKGKITNYNVQSSTCYTVFDGLHNVNGDVLKVTFKVKSGISSTNTVVSATPVIKHEADDYVVSLNSANLAIVTSVIPTPTPTPPEKTASFAATLKASATTVKAGESVTFTVVATGDDVACMGIAPEFDESVFTLSDMKWICDKTNVLNESDPVKFAEQSILFSEGKTYNNTSVFTFKLTAKADAKAGASDVKIIATATDSKYGVITVPTPNTVTINVEKAASNVAEFVITPSKTKFSAGESITFTVHFKGIDNVRKMGIKPVYDSEIFTLTDMKWLKTYEDATLQSDDDGKGTASLYMPSVINIGDMDILQFTLTAKQGIKKGEYDVTINPVVSKGDTHKYETKFNTVKLTNGVLRGDLDDNGKVDKEDVVYLTYALMFKNIDATKYPLNQDVDFDKSGTDSKDDAKYLLYYVMLGGERYPLD